MRGIARGTDGLCDADIGHDRVALLEQNTVRRETAMQYAAPVRVGQRGGDLVGETERVLDGQRTLAHETVAQALTLHERHHVKEKSGVRAGVVQRHDVRMPHPSRGRDLAQEPIVP